MTTVLNQWCRDVSMDPLPRCLAENRLLVIAKAPNRRQVREFRPTVMVPTFQKWGAGALLHEAKGYLQTTTNS